MKSSNAFLLFLTFNTMAATGIITFCSGQAMPAGKEKFMDVPDEIIKKEMASFTITGKKKFQEIHAKAIPVTEIPLWHNKDNEVLFDNTGFFNADIMVRINIEPGPEKQINKLTGITVVRDTKRSSPLPESAFADLEFPVFSGDIHSKSRTLTNCKAFYSKSKKWIYVYMHSVAGSKKYEVTWIVEYGRYLTRVIDEI